MIDSADRDILSRIQQMMSDEHVLRTDLASGAPAGREKDHARLEDLEQQLDQCWDLLRQRRAAREFGQDPGAAQVRPRDQVEGYLG